MSEKPFINALAASGYISLFASLVFNSPRFVTDNELGMMAPIIFLSLFVFSAALMGLFFVYQPVRLLIEGKQKEASKFFLTTIASFACITLTIVLAWFLLSTVLS